MRFGESADKAKKCDAAQIGHRQDFSNVLMIQAMSFFSVLFNAFQYLAHLNNAVDGRLK